MPSTRSLTRFAAAAALAFALGAAGTPAYADVQQNTLTGVAAEAITAPRQQDKMPSLMEALEGNGDVCCLCTGSDCCPCH